MNKRLTCAALLGVAATAAGSLPAQAGDHGRNGVQIGTLSCREAGGWGYLLGSSHRVRCVFTTNAPHGHAERYTGSISKFGVDVGYQASSVIVWAVFAPTGRLGHGALAGHYGGATASAIVGVGAGANVLIGSFHKSITLQPVSISIGTGLDLAAGIGELTLTSDHGRDKDHDDD
jgi:hypothetical protein